MTPQNYRIAKLYWQQAQDDLADAAKNIRQNPLIAMLTANQAVTNCLSAICIANDNIQTPSYNLVEMAEFCGQIYHEFLELKPLCLDLDIVQESKITSVIPASQAYAHYKKARFVIYMCQNWLIKLKIKPFYQLKSLKLNLLLKKITYGWQKP